MIRITIKNLKMEDLEVLRLELDVYNKYVAVHQLNNDFLNSIITFDVVNNLFYLIRSKTDQSKNEYSVSFTITQAAIILKCCSFNRTDRNTYTNHLINKLKIFLDKELRNLV
ncbi:hypothetical protein DNC80_14300 [Flavobacterium sp. SOK18b]|nr:hypothetical protein [Flavobacterium sp. SOK18b]